MAVELHAEVFEEPLAARLAQLRAPGVTLYWLGQAGFVIDSPALRLVIDPYLSDSLAEKYRGQRFPHIRLMPAPIAPQDLHGVDLILCTHRHTDHMDPGTLPALAAANPAAKLVVPEASLGPALERSGVGEDRLILMDHARRLEPLPGLAVTGLRSAHEAFEQDAAGRYPFLGYALELDGTRLYHSGDTIPYDGQAEAVAMLRPDLALLPVNGRDAIRAGNGVPGNLSVAEAVALARAAAVPHLLAHHFGLFDFNTADPQALAAAVAAGQLTAAATGIAYRLRHR